MVLGASNPWAAICRYLAEGLRTGAGAIATKRKANGAAPFIRKLPAPPYILMNYKEDVFSDVYNLHMKLVTPCTAGSPQNSQPVSGLRVPNFSG